MNGMLKRIEGIEIPHEAPPGVQNIAYLTHLLPICSSVPIHPLSEIHCRKVHAQTEQRLFTFGTHL